jgi:nucleotide-binding universal stress UspA family protein
MAYFEGSIPMNAKDVARIETQWANDAQAAVDLVKKMAETKGVKAKGVVSRSDIVSDAIIAAAKKQKADLVVMASHGRKGIKRLLLGSETQQVLTHCHVPVLVLR